MIGQKKKINPTRSNQMRAGYVVCLSDYRSHLFQHQIYIFAKSWKTFVREKYQFNFISIVYKHFLATSEF